MTMPWAQEGPQWASAGKFPCARPSPLSLSLPQISIQQSERQARFFFPVDSALPASMSLGLQPEWEGEGVGIMLPTRPPLWSYGRPRILQALAATPLPPAHPPFVFLTDKV